MKNLLRKEFSLSIDPLYLIFPVLFGALFLIPQWPFFLALMYFCFISVPNISSSYNTQRDNEFSMMLPVRKKDIVKARVFSFCILELMHLTAGAIFAAVHVIIFGADNFLLNLTPAFFGIAFSMFGLFNLVFFPLYFKTAYSFGLPVIVANIAALLYIAGIELLALFSSRLGTFLENGRISQVIILLAGIAVFVLLNIAAVRISARRFEKVDI